MRTLTLLGLAVAASVSVSVATSQEPPTLTSDQQARLQITPVTDGLYVIPGFDGSQSGGNVAVRVTGDGVILVDNKFPYSFDEITRQVTSVTSEPIRYVLNTHHHGDHAGANADFMRAAQIISHRNARGNMLRNGQAGAPPVIFSDQAAVFLGDVEVQAHHVGRGHTNGDAVIYFPDLRTIHTGDLVLWGTRLDGSTLAPFIDYANGGSGTEWVATLDRMLQLDFDTVIPGHGPILSRSDVETFREKFVTLISRMTDLVDAGVAPSEIAQRLEIDDLDWPLAPGRIGELFEEVRLSR